MPSTSSCMFLQGLTKYNTEHHIQRREAEHGNLVSRHICVSKLAHGCILLLTHYKYEIKNSSRLTFSFSFLRTFPYTPSRSLLLFFFFPLDSARDTSLQNRSEHKNKNQPVPLGWFLCRMATGCLLYVVHLRHTPLWVDIMSSAALIVGQIHLMKVVIYCSALCITVWQQSISPSRTAGCGWKRFSICSCMVTFLYWKQFGRPDSGMFEQLLYLLDVCPSTDLLHSAVLAADV